MAFLAASLVAGAVNAARAADDGLDAERERALSQYDTTPAEREEMRANGLPVVLRRVPPRYPQEMLKKRMGGCVLVGMVVTTEGVADEFRILNSEPPGAFDEAALAALVHWRFEAREQPYPGTQPMAFHVDPGSGTRTKRAPRFCDVPKVSLAETKTDRADTMAVSSVAPYYPPDAVKDHVEGCISMTFDIAPEGRVGNYELIASSPPGTFDMAMEWALNQWRFAPRESPARGGVAYRFVLQPPGGESAPEDEFDTPECHLPPGLDFKMKKGPGSPVAAGGATR